MSDWKPDNYVVVSGNHNVVLLDSSGSSGTDDFVTDEEYIQKSRISSTTMTTRSRFRFLNSEKIK